MTKQEKIAEYQVTVGEVMLMAERLAQLGIPELLAAIERAEAMGPILDPTLWVAKNRAMQEDKELLLAALPLRNIAEVLHEKNKEAKHAI